MKTVLLILTALLVVGAGGYFVGKKVSQSAQSQEAQVQPGTLYSCGMHPNVISDKPGNCPICGMKLTPIQSGLESNPNVSAERKIKYWQAPMDPTFISDKPGKSPMGMDLVPVYEDQIQTDAIVIDPMMAQNMGLRTVTAEVKVLARTIHTAGHITYNQELLTNLTTKLSGWVEKLHVENAGDPVAPGQPLLDLYSPDLVSAQTEYLSALKNVREMENFALPEIENGAADFLAAAKKRLLNWDVTPEQIEKLEQTGQVRKNLTFYSPVQGVVTDKEVTEGDYVEAGKLLFKLADLSSVWVLAHIYEHELPYLQTGQTAHIDLPYFPAETFHGRISYIYPYLDEMTRDVKVRVEVPNLDKKLKPEMYANVSFESQLSGTRLVVPEEAVIHSGKREIVFVELTKGKYSPREVQTGASGDGELIEIEQGLLPGEIVVASAQFMLDSESKTQEAIKKMLSSRQVQTGTSGAIPQPAAVKTQKTKAVETQPTKSERQKNLNLTPAKTPGSASEVYTCPMEGHEHILQVGLGKCPECGMELVPVPETGREVYTCPMESHRHILMPEAGKCPECGMELVPLGANPQAENQND
ncbi:MAG: efflux RND transporter periplasmic adaptor subunit [candidate division Zixibacteria bacterium]|nr:efflux RND transporter periplasmic adaptor subunit [candidate division Zixibacteria bacterium]